MANFVSDIHWITLKRIAKISVAWDLSTVKNLMEKKLLSDML